MRVWDALTAVLLRREFCQRPKGHRQEFVRQPLEELSYLPQIQRVLDLQAQC